MATLYRVVQVFDGSQSDAPHIAGDAANLTLKLVTDAVESAYAGPITELSYGYLVEVTEAGAAQSIGGVSSTPNAIVVQAAWTNASAALAAVGLDKVVRGPYEVLEVEVGGETRSFRCDLPDPENAKWLLLQFVTGDNAVSGAARVVTLVRKDLSDQWWIMVSPILANQIVVGDTFVAYGFGPDVSGTMGRVVPDDEMELAMVREGLTQQGYTDAVAQGMRAKVGHAAAVTGTPTALAFSTSLGSPPGYIANEHSLFVGHVLTFAAAPDSPYRAQLAEQSFVIEYGEAVGVNEYVTLRFSEALPAIPAVGDQFFISPPAGGSGGAAEPDGFPCPVTVTVDGTPTLGIAVTLQSAGPSTTHSTDANGVATQFVRPEGSYTITIPGGNGHDDYSGILTVDADGAVTGDEVDLAATVLPVTPPAPADYCLVECWAGRPGGAIPQDAIFKLAAHKSPEFSDTDLAVCYDPADATGVAVNETTGYAVLTLLQGAKVDLEVLDSAGAVARSRYGIYVPYAASVNWADMTTTVPTPPTP